MHNAQSTLSFKNPHSLVPKSYSALRNCALCIVLCALIFAASCSGHEETAGHISPAAATVEQAELWGVEAAHTIAESNHADTLDLQHSIIDAHATRSEMVLAGNNDAAEAFDQALRDELRQIDPAVAAELFP